MARGLNSWSRRQWTGFPRHPPPRRRQLLDKASSSRRVMKISRIDHVGIVVNDLPAAKAFFLDFGLEIQGEGEVEGEWVERIIGLNDVKNDIVMLQTPDGKRAIELIKFYKPLDEKG